MTATTDPQTVHFLKQNQTHDTEFCDRNLNLLAHAQAIELDIGSRCGGHGVCGGDRVRIKNSEALLSAITEAERHHLSEKEINAGWRLACQCFPEKSEQRIILESLIKPTGN